MRILVHDYAGHPFQVQLSRELARRGHEVTHAFAGGLLTPRGCLQRRTDDSDNFSITEVRMSSDYRNNKYSFLKRRGYEVAYGAELVALLRRQRPQVVISGNTPSEPQWAMSRAARRQEISVVSWVQDFYSLAVDKLARKKLPVIGALAGAWYRRLDRKCFAASAAVISISEDFAPMLAEFGVAKDRIHVVPNWAPLDELPLRPRRNPWSAGHDLDSRFVFVYSGTLAMKHNPELLLGLARTFRDDPAVMVVVVSEGPGADFLGRAREAEKLGNLLLLPFQPFSAMPEVLASADVLVTILESDAGVFSVPSKVLTYLTAGRPILGAMPAENLASRTVVSQAAGLCVPPDDLDGWIAAARRLREDTTLREQAGANGRRYAEREFDIRRIGDRFDRLLALVRQS